MPPDDSKQPKDEERDLMVAFLKKTLLEIDCSGPLDPGPSTLRRLNRNEYAKTMEAVIGVDLKLSDAFSPDASSHGFDNIGDALALSPQLIEQYHNAAKKGAEFILSQKSDSECPLPDVVRTDKTHAIRWLEAFASRAFRKPVSSEYISKLSNILDQATRESVDGQSMKEGIEKGLRRSIEAIFLSPPFLFRLEENQPETTAPYLVGHYEMASRLSYLLWSAPPDEELLQCASRGELHSTEVLRAQSFRMMADPKINAFVENFFGQWLSLRQLATAKPDSVVFPEFNDEIHVAMGNEWRAFLSHVVANNRPMTELIDADYTFASPKLRQWYGLDESVSNSMDKVTLTDRRRGGVFTMASWLTLVSDPTRTNVPRRGNVIATYVLGTPVPPPPPDVPALESSEEPGQATTMRETLERHRSDPNCAACHAKMDPFGLALENYDAIGRWRLQESDLPIDSHVTTESGTEINGPIGFKDYLLSNKEAFLESLIRNLTVYAYGRGPVPSDECVIREIQNRAEASGFGMGETIWAVIDSVPFRYRRNPED
jgi:hypothetical protein